MRHLITRHKLVVTVTSAALIIAGVSVALFAGRSTPAPHVTPVAISTLNAHSKTLRLHQVLVLPRLGHGGSYTVTSSPSGIVSYARGRAIGSSSTQTVPILVAVAVGHTTVSIATPTKAVTFTVIVTKK